MIKNHLQSLLQKQNVPLWDGAPPRQTGRSRETRRGTEGGSSSALLHGWLLTDLELIVTDYSIDHNLQITELVNCMRNLTKTKLSLFPWKILAFPFLELGEIMSSYGK